MDIFTIGASGISADQFFDRLEEARVTSLVDVRRHPSSQLAGFTKKESLSYFITRLLGISYIHELNLAPIESDLKSYRAKEIDWPEYERRYLFLLQSNSLDLNLDTSHWGERPALLCSEPSPDHCHRRLAADFLLRRMEAVRGVVHL